MFETISHNKIIGFPDGNIVSLCPTIDLLVISMNKMSIWVFRLNGERIYSINNKSIIIDLTWSPDGRWFAVSGVDGKVKIYDSNNGDLVNEFMFNGTYLINWCEFIPNNDNTHEELFKIDVLDNLPQLHDFENFQRLNYLLVTSEGQISIIFNSLVQFNIPTNFKFVSNNNLGLFNQFFVSDNNELIKLEFQTNVNVNHDIIQMVLNFCKIKLIVKNFKNYVSKIINEVKIFLTLLDRYLSNYLDNLTGSMGGIQSGIDSADTDKRTGYKNVIISLQNILLTHLIPKKLNDYWLNQFGERGYKKLLAQGNKTYGLIKNLVFKNIIQYYEKLIIILNYVKSVVYFNTLNNNNFQILDSDIEELMTLIKLQVKLCYEFIWDMDEECKLFNQCLNWFKFLIDSLIKDQNDEEIKFLPSFNVSDLLNYFNNYLFNSRISKYLKLNIDVDILNIDPVINEGNNLEIEVEKLDNHINDKLFKPFESYFQSIISFSQPVEIDLHKCELQFIDYQQEKIGIIISLNENQISLTKIINMEVKTLEFNKFINYKIFEHYIIVLSFKNNHYIMEKYDISKIFGDDTMPIESKIVESPSPSTLVINASRNYGCVFESNRKDYSLIQL